MEMGDFGSVFSGSGLLGSWSSVSSCRGDFGFPPPPPPPPPPLPALVIGGCAGGKESAYVIGYPPYDGGYAG